MYQWQRNGANLEGETNATLTLRGVQSTTSGSYRVVVANAVGVVASEKALLEVAVSNVVALKDLFAERVVVTNRPSGTISGSNSNAGRETREENHAGKPGASRSGLRGGRRPAALPTSIPLGATSTRYWRFIRAPA